MLGILTNKKGWLVGLVGLGGEAKKPNFEKKNKLVRGEEAEMGV